MPTNNLNISEIVEQISSLKVLVIGDLMLDRYCYGSVSRISPEAPVPIINVESKEDRLGGAANVALNCKSLGANVHIAGIIGEDEAGGKIRQLLQSEDIDHALVITDSQYPTTIKTRIISRHQQLFRMDEEHTGDLGLKTEHHFIEVLLKHIQIEKPDVVIFEDYDKGALNENIISKAMAHCRHLGCITAVDPKHRNFFHYKGADIFKPNLSEVQEAFKLKAEKTPLELIEVLNGKVKETLHPAIVLITLSEMGIFVNENNTSAIIPAKKRKIADVSGAGDTVIATASLVYAVTKDGSMAAQYANVAGGMVCEYVGVVPVNVADWKSEIEKMQ